MKFGQPILTTELSGSLSGVVASSARGGIGYFRVRARPSNPRTYLQLTIRAILSGSASAWRSTLTTLQRANWTAIAKTGESGIDRYTAANTILQQGGSARVDVAPAAADLAWVRIPQPSDFTLTTIGGTGYVGTASLAGAGTLYGATGERINCYVQSDQQPASRLFPVGNMAFANSFTINGTTTPTFLIPAFTHPDLVGLAAGDVVQVAFIKFKTTGEVASRIGTNVTAT